MLTPGDGYSIELVDLGYCLFSSKTWFINRHLSDADGDKPDTRFLLLDNEFSQESTSC